MYGEKQFVHNYNNMTKTIAAGYLELELDIEKLGKCSGSQVRTMLTNIQTKHQLLIKQLILTQILVCSSGTYNLECDRPDCNKFNLQDT